VIARPSSTTSILASLPIDSCPGLGYPHVAFIRDRENDILTWRPATASTPAAATMIRDSA
jgi:hypothetical protein